MRRFSLSTSKGPSFSTATGRGFPFGPAISVVLIPALLLGLTACNPSASPEPTEAESPASRTESAAAVTAPQPISAADIQAIIRESGTPVVVSLWASWSRTARDSTTNILPLQRADQAGRIRWIFVCIDTLQDTTQHAEPWLREAGLEIPVYYKSATETDSEFLQRLCPDWSGALPATMVFKSDGTLQEIFETPVRSSQILESLQAPPAS
jgi:hypothetical protein